MSAFCLAHRPMVERVYASDHARDVPDPRLASDRRAAATQEDGTKARTRSTEASPGM
jgi:hypothetical protein